MKDKMKEWLTWAFVLVLLPLLLLLTQCKKSEDLYWDISVTGPILKSHIDLHDILPDSLIKTDCLLFSYIYYNGEIYNFSADSLFNTNQEISSEVYKLPVTYNLQPGQQFISTNETTKFDFGDAEISRMIVKSGTVKITISNSIIEPIVCKYLIPAATKSGQGFSESLSVPGGQTGQPAQAEFLVDISGFEIDFSGLSGLSANKLQVMIDAYLDPLASAITVTPTDSIVIEASFEKLEIEYVRGYFGQQHINIGPDFSNIDVFDYFQSGVIDLEQAYATLNITNGFGVDLSVLIDTLFVESTESGQKIYLTDPVIGQPVTIARATKAVSAPPTVYPVVHSFILNPGSIEQMIEIMPDRLGYSLNADLNPNGNVSSGNDFFYADYPLKASYELEIPLHFSAKGLTLVDNVKFKFTDNSITQGKLYLIADNTFPLQADLQILLYDENDVFIDSLSAPQQVDAADTLPDYYTKLKRTIITIDIDNEMLENLRLARSFDIRTVLKTMPEAIPARIRSSYYLDLKITANLDYLLEL